MEKEQKKLLLVAISVGVFLLVTFTVAMSVLSPRSHMDEVIFSSSRPYQAIRPQNDSGIVITPEDTVFQITEQANDTVSVIVPVFENDTAAAADIATDGFDNDRLTINIPRPEAVAIPGAAVSPGETAPALVVSVTPARTAPARTPAPAPAPATRAPAAPAATSARTQSTAAAASTTRETARQTAQTRMISDYWVQTHAFSRLFRAEDVKELLATKGITSIIETGNVNGQVLYRVRIGPYTSEREANYWLALVQSIDGFEASQVRQTIRQQ